jgi:hypothetical protein
MPIPNIPPGFTVADIQAELNSNANTLTALGLLANPKLVPPFLMSDFANYSHTVAGYYRNDGVNDYAQITGGNAKRAIGAGEYTISFWVRQNAGVHQNAQMINIAPAFSSSNRIMIDYNTTNNQLRFNHRQGGTNTIKGFYMNNNTSKTGLSGGWTSSNRGNTYNNSGWTLLTYVYNGNQSGLSGLTVWWNTQQLDYQASVTGTRGNLAMANIRIGENIHNVGSAGNADMDFDGITIWNRLLAPDEIEGHYIAGPTGPPVSADYISHISFDNGTFTDIGGHWGTGTIVNGGQLLNH